MRSLILDRFEGTFAICEGEEHKMYAIETSEIPAGAAEGDVLEISNDGVLTINAEKTAARRSRIKGKQDKLWK